MSDLIPAQHSKSPQKAVSVEPLFATFGLETRRQGGYSIASSLRWAGAEQWANAPLQPFYLGHEARL